jgi:hypothetical protein
MLELFLKLLEFDFQAPGRESYGCGGLVYVNEKVRFWKIPTCVSFWIRGDILRGCGDFRLVSERGVPLRRRKIRGVRMGQPFFHSTASSEGV